MTGKPWTEAERDRIRRGYFAGESDKEIADALGRSANSVQTYRFRQMRLLRNDQQMPSGADNAAVGDGGYSTRIKAAKRRHLQSLKGHRFEDVPESVLRDEFVSRAVGPGNSKSRTTARRAARRKR